MAAKKKSTTKRARKRKPSRQVMQARTQGLSFLNKAAFVLLVILICVAVGVTVFPQMSELKRLEADLENAQQEEREALAHADQRTRELGALRNSQEYRELRGRDLLDRYIPGETVIRIRRD